MGPFEVKVRRSLVKRWICLFTCLTFRAVHCELTHSLSTKSCVVKFRRFASRRCAPLECLQITAHNFRVIVVCCQKSCRRARQPTRIVQQRLPTRARSGKSVKMPLKTVSNSLHHPSDEVLETIMLGAGGIVNSRPLTYMPMGAADQVALITSYCTASEVKQSTVQRNG